MANATAPADVPTAIPIGRPLLVSCFGVDKPAVELVSRLELRVEFGMKLMLESGMEPMLGLTKGEAMFDRKVDSVLNVDADKDEVIEVAVPNFDPMVNRFTASTPGQQLRLC